MILDKFIFPLSVAVWLEPQYDYVYSQWKNDVKLCSISGGTDIISCFALGNPTLPIYRGELQCCGLGMDVDVFDEQGNSLVDTKGELVCKSPFPSMPIYFWNDLEGEKYAAAYFSQYKNTWAHGDYAKITIHNGLIIYGRSDTTLNPGGIRIGSAEIYRQVEKIDDILESVVVSQRWQGDTRIILFVKLQPNQTINDKLRAQINHNIKTHLSPRHLPSKIIQINNIPKTVNGKIVELAIQQVIHGETITNLHSLANPEALDEYQDIPELHTS